MLSIFASTNESSTVAERRKPSGFAMVSCTSPDGSRRTAKQAVIQTVVLLASLLVPCELWGDESSSDHQPHPWLKDVPPGLSRLIDIGNVEMVEDQLAVQAADRTALTVFSFTFAHRMRYRTNELAKDKKGQSQFRIRVSFYNVEVSVSHRILLSSNYRPAKPWDSALLLHEFDHVAISTDPRLFAILRSLEGRVSTIIVTAPKNGKPNDAWAKLKIEESSKVFQQAVEELVNSYYVRLDDISRHGLQAIDDRAKFFAHIYSIDDLQVSDFAYLDEVREHVEQVEPEAIKRHYQIP